jgi:UDP-N-acetylglucosamine 1-carboxyvinyltransferase
VQYIITGPNVAKGTITVSGSKNFSIKALIAALLTKGKTFYNNVPNHGDVNLTLTMLRQLGCVITFNKEKKTCEIDSSEISSILPSGNANMAMFLFGAALLHRFDRVQFPLNNGCNLGERLCDFHIDAFITFGAKYEATLDSTIIFSKTERLKSCSINLPYTSVGATETAIFLAVLAKGVTKIHNAAIEPEVQALVTALITMGAKIFFESDRTIVIHGVEQLESNQLIEIHGDLLEAATWATLAAASNGEILVKGFIPELIGSFLGQFVMLGGGMKRTSANSAIFYRAKEVSGNFSFETGVFPALRTDLQPLLAALAAINKMSTVTIHETVYHTRVDCVNSFKNFNIDAYGFSNCLGSPCRFNNKSIHSVVIVTQDSEINAPSHNIEVTSIRNGMADVILACIANGTTTIDKIELVLRGYSDLFKKLMSIGIQIKQIKN